MRLLAGLFRLAPCVAAWLGAVRADAAADENVGEIVPADPMAALCQRGLSFAAPGPNNDVGKALELMLQAAEQGSPECARHVGFTYFYGKGAAEVANHELGLQWYNTACDRGDADSLVHMAALHSSNDTFPQHYNEDLAKQYLQRGAKLGAPAAMRALAARHLASGRLPEHNDWIKKCAEKMDPLCMGQYGMIMAKGEHGHRLRLVKGLEMLHEAARRDDAMAMMEVGQIELKEDPIKAEPYFARAAEKGYPGAVFQLSRVKAAQRDDDGRTYEHDFLAEVALLELCAKEHKDVQCMHLLGLYHLFGVGTLQVDPAAGMDVRSKSRAHSVCHALLKFWASRCQRTLCLVSRLRLPWILLHGFAVAPLWLPLSRLHWVPTARTQYFLAAGQKGNAQTLAVLATFFIDGFHVMKDHARALTLAEAAAKRGNANAAKLLEEHTANGGFQARPITAAFVHTSARVCAQLCTTTEWAGCD